MNTSDYPFGDKKLIEEKNKKAKEISPIYKQITLKNQKLKK